MKDRILISIMCLMAGVVLYTALHIEILNAQANYYLPRKDRNEDGSFADGKWRVSEENSPRDRLRNLVGTFGLMQYVLSPLSFILAVIVYSRFKQTWAKVAGSIVFLISVVAIWLMLHRECFQSLG